jgi:ATP-dependent DNA helicase RecQ
MKPVEILREYWGHDSFRPMQEEIIRSVLDGKDTLAILPTGGGKSVCFQVPALAMDGVCIVITPLIALMQDQLQQLTKKGIPAAALYAGMGYLEIRSTLRQAIAGEIRFLYVSPERLATGSFRDALPHLPLNLIAVDEAHCLSQWGYDFRPAYLDIYTIRERQKKQVPILALTASATGDVQEDICKKLRLKDPVTFRQSFERPNLSYSVIRTESRISKLTEILKKVPGSGIVYCKTRRQTVEIARQLEREGMSAGCYHAGLDRETRRSRQQQWIDGQLRIMACTNAFGMGIDKPDVRIVIHLAPPDCLENYYQEAGRAGRDGNRSYAVMLFQEGDVQTLERLPETRYPPMSFIRMVYQSLANYLQLASGLGEDQSFPIDLQDLCQRFKLPLTETIHALQAMQQAGILDFQEQIFKPPVIQCLFDRDALFRFEEANPHLEPVLKALLRTYGGLFEHPVPISERQLAKSAERPLKTVEHDLFKLHTMGVISYQPVRNSPQLRFLQERVRAEDLYIEPLGYLKRKEIFFGRIRDMIGYMTGVECRAVAIGRYFGDPAVRPCGICDRCVDARRKRTSTDEVTRISGKIESILHMEGPASADKILEALSEEDRPHAWPVLEFLIGEGWIRRLSDDRIEWTGKKKGPG